MVIFDASVIMDHFVQNVIYTWSGFPFSIMHVCNCKSMTKAVAAPLDRFLPFHPQ